MNMLDTFFDKANILWGGVIAILSCFTKDTGVLFVFFLLLNIIDCVFGYMKAYKTKTIKSGKGAEGIIKKLAYWVIIAIAFMLSEYFIDMGNIIGVDLNFLHLFGWFILGVYIINEITSIVENMVVLGIPVPEFFLRGLHAAKTAIDDAGDKVIPKEDEDNED